MITVYRSDDHEFIAAAQRFRGAVYLAEGAISELVDGRHIEEADYDPRTRHILDTEAGEIRGCIRYQRVGRGRVRIGGWAVADDARQGRLAVRMVQECVSQAEQLGDYYATATATARNQACRILRKMGGRLIMRYYDPAYRCEMELLEFHLADMTSQVTAAYPQAA